MTPPKNILVSTDFSEMSSAAKVYGAVLAGAFGAALHLLHVIPDEMPSVWGVEAAYLPQVYERTEQEARDRLEGMLTEEDRWKLETHLVVRIGSPASSIVTYADEHDIDLIVMGTQGHGAIEKMWIGSVTEKVMRKASCPVLTLRRAARHRAEKLEEVAVETA